MDDATKAAYLHGTYAKRKAKLASQDDWPVEYRSWLAADPVRGAHCKLCVISLVKPADKLSTTGYG